MPGITSTWRSHCSNARLKKFFFFLPGRTAAISIVSTITSLPCRPGYLAGGDFHMAKDLCPVSPLIQEPRSIQSFISSGRFRYQGTYPLKCPLDSVLKQQATGMDNLLVKPILPARPKSIGESSQNFRCNKISLIASIRKNFLQQRILPFCNSYLLRFLHYNISHLLRSQYIYINFSEFYSHFCINCYD